MKKIARILKRLLRRPAILLVTLWARRTYNQGVRAAELRHEKEGVTVYLAADSWRPDHLVTYDRAQFRLEKRVYGVAARLLTMNTLRSGCYYYTKGRGENDGMPDDEKEIRRQAFIKERLRLAGLL